jgi:hypothetical protein
MSEQATGALIWGQAGIYDAIDDRLAIAAVTRYRTGLAWPAEPRAGTGLNVIVAGGWVGVTDCGDRTSAVVGSRTDMTVTAAPGPGTGTREDLIWVDPQPDAGTWTMRVIPEAASGTLPGLMIGRITVPANATLASQMDIRAVGASLERRLMMYYQAPDQVLNVVRNEQTWGDAAQYTFATGALPLEPGQWYKATFTASSPMMLTSPPGYWEGRIGIGSRTQGQPANAAVLGRAAVISYRPSSGGTNYATHAQVEWVFRHPPNAARVNTNFDGRIWSAGAATYRPWSIGSQGPGLQITVEDIGS